MLYGFGLVLDEIKKDVDPSSNSHNLLSSLNTGFLFLSGPIVSSLVNNYGCRRVTIVAGIITALCYFVSAYLVSIYVMLIFYGIIGGISAGCTCFASFMIISEYFEKKLGVANGVTCAASGVGCFIISLLVANLIDKYDWRTTLLICSLIFCIAPICGVFLKSPVDTRSRLNCVDDIKQDKRPFLGFMKNIFHFKLLIDEKCFFLITISNLFLFAGYFTPFLYIKSIAVSNRFSVNQGALLISIIGNKRIS
jgi:MFS family permease